MNTDGPLSAIETFDSGLFECFADSNVCAAVGLAPCLTTFISLPTLMESYCQYQALTAIGEPVTFSVVSLLMHSPLMLYAGVWLYPLRVFVKQQIRAAFKRQAGLQEDCFNEFCTHFFCSPCATCQELRAGHALAIGGSAPLSATTTTTTTTTSYHATGVPPSIDMDT